MLSRVHTNSSKPGIAANTAAAKAFPDRGSGGYLGRVLHTELVKVSHLGSRASPHSSAACQCVVDSLDTGSMFMPIQRTIDPAVAW